MSEALAEKLQIPGGKGKPWMETFGKLRGLSNETVRISRIMEKEFGQVEAEDWP